MRLPLLGILLSLSCQVSVLAAPVSTPAASFDFGEEWLIVRGPTAESFTLRSQQRPVEVNVLAQLAPKITLSNIEVATKRLLSAALKDHDRLANAKGLILSDVESKVSQLPFGWAGEFIGNDDKGRRFRHLLLVRPGLILVVYVDSRVLSQEALLEVAGEVVRSMKNAP